MILPRYLPAYHLLSITCLLQVLKWYLSSFHASRKSSVAKKPYNPILGEIFRCSWELPRTEAQPMEKAGHTVEPPIPWCTQKDLVFLSEQVPSLFGGIGSLINSL